MVKILIKYFLLFFLFGLGFGQVDYSDIQEILNDNCTSCHGNSGGLNLSSYTDLMSGTSNNGPAITPYNHASSELWIRVNSGQMPPGNNDLTDEQIDLIAQWIDEGALEELDCDPTLTCWETETCCVGLLYPTTCCENNCDEPIGECGDDLSYDDIHM